MIVWVLVVYLGAFRAGGPAVIDNIADKANCEAAGKIAVERYLKQSTANIYLEAHYTCIAVRKAKDPQ